MLVLNTAQQRSCRAASEQKGGASSSELKTPRDPRIKDLEHLDVKPHIHIPAVEKRRLVFRSAFWVKPRQVADIIWSPSEPPTTTTTTTSSCCQAADGSEVKQVKPNNENQETKRKQSIKS